MNHQKPVNRRRFIQTVGTGTAAAFTFNLSGFLGKNEIVKQENEQDNTSAAGTLPFAEKGPDLGNLYPKIDELARENSYPYSFSGDRFHSLEEFKTTNREKIFELYGYRPASAQLNVEIVERKEFKDFIREKIIFSTSEYFRVPAYVHIPRNITGRAPAIVDLHSHGGMFLYGKEKVIDFEQNDQPMIRYHQVNYEGRPTTTQLVRRGYIVITIDAFLFGERRVLMDEDQNYGWDRSAYSADDIAHLNDRCRTKANTVVKSLIYAGKTWSGIVSWDDIRTVDYLVSRPDVDPERIGCIGVSFGGWRSLFLAGLDERISAACVTGFMSTVKPMIKNHIDTHSWVHFVPGLHRYLDIPDVASMMAPKPLLVQQCRQDGLFPLHGMVESVDKIAAIYEKAGVPNQFEGRFYEQPHILNIEMQDEAFNWLDRHLM